MNFALDAAGEALGLPASARARLALVGDEALPSAFRVTDLAAGTIGVAALAVSELVAGTTAAPRVTVDRRLASLWFGTSIVPTGWSLPALWDAVAGDYRTRDGWIRLHTNAPAHRDAALRVLGCVAERTTVADAVSRYDADALEDAIVDAGGCAATMRSGAAWDAHPQGLAVAAEPLIDVVREASGEPGDWRPDPARPLGGLRVLDLTRVLAGPIATRFLAGYGAEVLRIDPPHWDEPGVIPDVTLGKRCARLDLEDRGDRATFEGLLRDADIVVHGYRPGALDGLGYDARTRRSINATAIDVSLDAYGWTGPWARRRGFDSLVQMSCGIAEAGSGWQRADRPTPLPVQALDHATGYLIAAAAITGIARRLADGRGSTMRLSLARTARLLVDAGSQESDVRPGPTRTDDDLAQADEQTPWGRARRLRPPVAIDGSPLAWDRGATGLGSAGADWLVRR